MTHFWRIMVSERLYKLRKHVSIPGNSALKCGICYATLYSLAGKMSFEKHTLLQYAANVLCFTWVEGCVSHICIFFYKWSHWMILSRVQCLFNNDTFVHCFQRWTFSHDKCHRWNQANLLVPTMQKDKNISEFKF